MKKIVIVCFALMLSCNLIYSQNFKEVKTAQDVIDNYIEANGGRDNLNSVKSISMSGTINLMGKDVPVDVYMSRSVLYMNLKGDDFGFTSAMDYDNKKGWSKFGSKIKDMNESEVSKNKSDIGTALWDYYTHKDENGVTYELLQNEQVNGSDVYVVDFNKKDTTVMTVYFDTKTFQRLKQHKLKQYTEYSDFKPINGISMPFLIKSEQGTINVSNYEFNGSFDKKLLDRPDNEK